MKNFNKTLKIIIKKTFIGRMLIKTIRYPIQYIQLRRSSWLWKEILQENLSIEDKFNKIYNKKMWGKGESVSGAGSSLYFTENLRKEFPTLIQKYSIKSIFDAPCGDLNWMKHLIPTMNVKYVGGDIVKDLIEGNKNKYENENTSFLHIDIIKDIYPTADIMICRDCLFHFSYYDVKCVLDNFVSSNIPYLFLTSHLSTQPNHDIKTGDYRFINFFEPPFYFDANPLERVNDSMPPESPRQMCLWSRSQIINSLSKIIIH